MDGSKANNSKAVVPIFLQKLYEIVNNPENKGIIQWSENGTSFYILDQDRLSHEVLGHWFKHQKFTSFARQLNMYGFRKVQTLQQHFPKKDTNPDHYEHPQFISGRPDLLGLIQRKKTNGILSGSPPVNEKLPKQPSITVKSKTQEGQGNPSGLGDNMGNDIGDMSSQKELMISILEDMDSQKRFITSMQQSMTALQQEYMKQQETLNWTVAAIQNFHCTWIPNTATELIPAALNAESSAFGGYTHAIQGQNKTSMEELFSSIDESNSNKPWLDNGDPKSSTAQHASEKHIGTLVIPSTPILPQNEANGHLSQNYSGSNTGKSPEGFKDLDHRTVHKDFMEYVLSTGVHQIHNKDCGDASPSFFPYPVPDNHVIISNLPRASNSQFISQGNNLGDQPVDPIGNCAIPGASFSDGSSTTEGSETTSMTSMLDSITAGESCQQSKIHGIDETNKLDNIMQTMSLGRYSDVHNNNHRGTSSSSLSPYTASMDHNLGPHSSIIIDLSATHMDSPNESSFESSIRLSNARTIAASFHDSFQLCGVSQGKTTAGGDIHNQADSMAKMNDILVGSNLPGDNGAYACHQDTAPTSSLTSNRLTSNSPSSSSPLCMRLNPKHKSQRQHPYSPKRKYTPHIHREESTANIQLPENTSTLRLVESGLDRFPHEPQYLQVQQCLYDVPNIL